MKRGEFLKTLLVSTFAMNSLQDLKKYSDALSEQEHRTPLLFVGHGSPMNAIEDNEFSLGWKELGKELPTPKAILCISAHWETNGTMVTAMPRPKTIHDFGGFPQALFDVQYAAPGSPELAKETQSLLTKTQIGLDTSEWGLDHGCWSVLNKMYPKADIPVIQLSLDYKKNTLWHYELAKELATLRKKGVLILSSGNMVHNLGMLNWSNPSGKFDWAEEMNLKFKSLISTNDHKPLINYKSLGKSAELAINSAEHYLPLLYTLGLKEENEPIKFFNDKTIMGSISMTSVRVG